MITDSMVFFTPSLITVNAHYTLQTAHCKLHTAHCTHYCTVWHTADCMNTVYCSQYTVQCTLHTVHSTFHTEHFKLYNEYITLYIIPGPGNLHRGNICQCYPCRSSTIWQRTGCSIMSVSHTPNQASRTQVILNSGLRPSFNITQCSHLVLFWGMGH